MLDETIRDALLLDMIGATRALREAKDEIAYLMSTFVDPAPLTPDTPDAAAEVNAATEGPREYPEADALADEVERLRAENADLKDRLALADFPQPLPPDPSTKMSDYVPAEIRSLMEEGETFTQARKRLSELLNVELAELKNLRGMAGEDLAREADVERLLGLFARLGEI